MVVTVSSWLNFGRPVPPRRGSAAGRNFWLCLTTASARSVCVSSEHFFHSSFFCYWGYSCLVAAHVVAVSNMSTLLSLCTQFKTLFVMFFIAAVLPLILLKIFRVHFYGSLMSRWSFV